MFKRILRELAEHAPFTALGGVLGGVVALLVFHFGRLPGEVAEGLFDCFHPLHVLLSALVTTSVYRRYRHARLWKTVTIGIVGSIGIGTLSDSLLPWLGEVLLGMEHAAPHIGFIEIWYLVWPAAIAGVALAWAVSHTKVPHAGHVLVSTAASLAHILWSMGPMLSLAMVLLIPLILAVAVWVPCCTSDIVFPLLFVDRNTEHPHTESCIHWPFRRSRRHPEEKRG
jgi:hypothetical protein